MNYQQTFKIGLKQGCLFYALSTLLLAIQFGSYIIGSTVLDFMDFEGWVFFIASSVSHASQFALIPYLLGTIVLACRCHKSGQYRLWVSSCSVSSITSTLRYMASTISISMDLC